MKMRQRNFGILVLAALFWGGCAHGEAESESDTGSQQAALEIYHYRYAGEVLEATFDNSAGDHVLLEGPDNARIEELMNLPSSGVATDPSDSSTFWIYTNETEREQVADTLRSLMEQSPAAGRVKARASEPQG